jgi:hypothetical protein
VSDLARHADDAEFRLRRLAQRSERAGWVILALASREALRLIREARAEESAFRVERGIS